MRFFWSSFVKNQTCNIFRVNGAFFSCKNYLWVHSPFHCYLFIYSSTKTFVQFSSGLRCIVRFCLNKTSVSQNFVKIVKKDLDSIYVWTFENIIFSLPRSMINYFIWTFLFRSLNLNPFEIFKKSFFLNSSAQDISHDSSRSRRKCAKRKIVKCSHLSVNNESKPLCRLSNFYLNNHIKLFKI